jgi:hypothetical protein
MYSYPWQPQRRRQYAIPSLPQPTIGELYEDLRVSMARTVAAEALVTATLGAYSQFSRDVAVAVEDDAPRPRRPRNVVEAQELHRWLLRHPSQWRR